MLCVIVLLTIKPAQVLHEKNGEQPWHSFSGAAFFDAAAALTEDSFMHTSSAQQGLADSNTTNSDKNMQSIFTTAKIQF